jgi:hypothetical protein
MTHGVQLLVIPGSCKQRCVFSEQIARKAVASDHLRSSSYGASANLARSRHSGATAERLPYLAGKQAPLQAMPLRDRPTPVHISGNAQIVPFTC